MTPRRLDPEVIVGKLRAMRRLLHELDHLGPVDADRFAREYATQLVVERVERLVAAVPLAAEQYGEYVRQVARWLADRAG